MGGMDIGSGPLMADRVPLGEAQVRELRLLDLAETK
jgi:hypothetical protein